ncbi:MAG TPA: hypothetical protein VFT50_03350 [Baekduia sp.]|nr:hypothetical protein [Baekduia sp.]
MRVVVAVIVWMAVLAGAAEAHEPRLLQETFDGHGDPRVMVILGSGGGLEGVSWRVCRPHRPCSAPARPRLHPDERVLEPGRQPAGTTFVARVTYRGRTTPFRTPRWRGRVRDVATARLVGHPRVGAVVRAAPARWTGGWGGETDDLRVEVCTRPTSGCQTLLAPDHVGPDHISAAGAVRGLVSPCRRLPRGCRHRPALDRLPGRGRGSGHPAGSRRLLVAAGANLTCARLSPGLRPAGGVKRQTTSYSDREFRFGLDLILDGLERMVREG